MFAGSSKASSFSDVESFKKGFNLILYEHKNLSIVNPGIYTWAENTFYGWNIKVINICRLPKQKHSFRFPDLLDPTCKFSLLATILWDIFQNIQLCLCDLGRQTPKRGGGDGEKSLGWHLLWLMRFHEHVSVILWFAIFSFILSDLFALPDAYRCSWPLPLLYKIQ